MKALLIKIVAFAVSSILLVGCSGGGNGHNQATSDSKLDISPEGPKQTSSSLNLTPIDFTQFSDTNLVNCLQNNGVAFIQVQSLVCPNYDIHTLDGLEQLTDLRVINLSGNRIQDLTPLAALQKLHTLNLSHNGLSSVAGIESLENLAQLNINHNHISDGQGLESLTNLQRLYIRHNALQNLDFLSGMVALVNLDAEHNLSSGVPRLPSSIKTFSI